MKLLAVLIGVGVLGAANPDAGIELFRKGKLAEAEKALREVVSAEPSNARAQRFLGMALASQNKVDDATAVLNRAKQLEEGTETQVAFAHLYLAQKNLSQAEAALMEGTGEEADFARGLLAMQRKEYAEAARHFEAVIQANPENSYAHYQAGLAYNGLKRKDKMLTHFELFLRMNPEAPEARKVRAVMRTGN
jgi:tetratricopeptide (TPR) repeat protein